MVVNYDGTSPSGFTGSTFTGMSSYVCNNDDSKGDGEKVFGGLADVFDAALEDGIAMATWNLFALCLWGGAFSICWNPANWF